MLCLLQLTLVFSTSLFFWLLSQFSNNTGELEAVRYAQINQHFFLWDFLGWHLLTYQNLGVAPFEKFVAFLSSMEKSPRVKKLQADKRIILSQDQYVNTLTSRTCLEELHFPLPNYHLGKQLYHHVYLNFKHFESRSPRFWNLVSIPGSVWPKAWPWANLGLSFWICSVALRIFTQFNIPQCWAKCKISALNNSGVNLRWGLVVTTKGKIKTLGF